MDCGSIITDTCVIYVTVLPSLFTCDENEFQCDDQGDHLCLTYDRTCDNIPDCIDGSDEDTQYCG